jgi:hypothetical protein
MEKAPELFGEHWRNLVGLRSKTLSWSVHLILPGQHRSFSTKDAHVGQYKLRAAELSGVHQIKDTRTMRCFSEDRVHYGLHTKTFWSSTRQKRRQPRNKVEIKVRS